ncbi:CsiV family protein [Thiomicrorhabdus sp.]|uniref:CsiV family protein n=1 Tax=Thiomicrorhabdus sp. TaxID=2039724 RepID=UPI0029C9AB53|nr:CsiV family protein [Thiomicrorhabdus sp.]
MLHPYLPKAVIHWILFSLSLFLFSAQAQAAREYTVEVIVFENFTTKHWLEEFWPDLQQQPYDSRPATSYTSFPAAGNGLNSVVNRMQASKGYRILFHETWKQPFSGSKSNAPMTLIENASNSASNFKGYLQFYKTRYPHVTMDLQFERRIPQSAREAFAAKQQRMEADLPVSWRFDWQSASKLERGKLYYLDHPLLGVLIKVY